MKYLCMICADTVMEMMPEADAAKHFDEYAAFTRDIKKSGHFLGANRLKPVDSATTVRVRSGKVMVTDGPFAETKEQFGGYYLIECASEAEALNWAKQAPTMLHGGGVELRPVMMR